MIRQNPEKVLEVAQRIVARMQDDPVEWDAIGIVAVITEVRDYGETKDDGTGGFNIYCTDPRGWVQAALLQEALAVIDDGQMLDEEDDEEHRPAS